MLSCIGKRRVLAGAVFLAVGSVPACVPSSASPPRFSARTRESSGLTGCEINLQGYVHRNLGQGAKLVRILNGFLLRFEGRLEPHVAQQ